MSKLSKTGLTSGDRRAGGRTRDTLIWFVVNVPVLSEQMTLVLPRVSTDGSERTMAFLRAIFFVPSARHVVMTAGRPSGMAATARATAICPRQGSQRLWTFVPSASDEQLALK